MDIGDWKATRHLNPLYREIRRLGLERNLAELDAFGLTVVEPEKVGPRMFVDRLSKTLLEVARRRSGHDADGSASLHHKNVGQLIYALLPEDRIFEEAVSNPVAMALVTYLLGEGCILSSVTGQVKAQDAERSLLHSDNGMIPSPFPPYAQVANATFVLTDYTREGGALAFVPGSHRLCRHPAPSEVSDEELLVPVEAPAGSMIVWHGNLWHAGFPKRTAGLRLNLILLFSRMYLLPQERIREQVTPEMLRRNPPRFAKLVGEHVAYGWGATGPDFSTEERRRYLGLERDPGERLYD
jgi:hypothetical protein